MKLTVNGDDIVESVTESLLEKELDSIANSDGDSFLILSKNDMSYMQVCSSDVEGFVLEYQEGDLNNHYSCCDSPLSECEVVQAFKDYLNGNERWKTNLKWKSESMSQGENSIGKMQLIIAGLLIFGVVLIVLNT